MVVLLLHQHLPMVLLRVIQLIEHHSHLLHLLSPLCHQVTHLPIFAALLPPFLLDMLVVMIHTAVLTATASGPASSNYGTAGPQTIVILPRRAIAVTNVPSSVSAGSSYVITINIGSSPSRQSLTLGFTASPSPLVTVVPSSYTFITSSNNVVYVTITGASLLTYGIGTFNISVSGGDKAGYYFNTPSNSKASYVFNTVAVRK
jgi:hypothetical protein